MWSIEKNFKQVLSHRLCTEAGNCGFQGLNLVAPVYRSCPLREYSRRTHGHGLHTSRPEKQPFRVVAQGAHSKHMLMPIRKQKIRCWEWISCC